MNYSDHRLNKQYVISATTQKDTGSVGSWELLSSSVVTKAEMFSQTSV